MQRGFGKMALCKQPTTQSQRMNIHPNARLILRSREALVQSILNRRLTAKAAAAAFLVSERTVHKWLTRYRTGGVAALADRCCAPHNRPSKNFASPSCCRALLTSFTAACLSNRSAVWAVQGHCLAHLARPFSSSPLPAGSASSSAPLLPRHSRRAHSPGHQKAGPDRATQSPGYQQPQRPRQGSRLGVCSCGHR